MVDDRPSWLNDPESDRLEYKSAKALDHRESIVRAVVALLNHRGGHVIVGVNDQGVPEGKNDLDRERDRLQTALIDSIEPRPVKGHLEVRCFRVLGSQVLEIQVRKASRTGKVLYAERRNGLYGFWMRSGPTTRALSLAEVEQHWKEPQERSVPKRWDAPLAKESEIVLVLQAEFRDQGLDRGAVQRLLAQDRRRELRRRENGWTVADDYDQFEKRQGRTIQAGKHGERKWLCFDSNANTVRFEGRGDFLRWQAPAGIKEEVIYPFALVEGVASFFLLLQQYVKDAGAEGDVNCQLGIWHPEGWRLGPHRPGTIAWLFTDRYWKPPHDSTNVERAAEVSCVDLLDASDAVAYPFILHVYEDFGYDESAIPFWVEAEKRFIFEP